VECRRTWCGVSATPTKPPPPLRLGGFLAALLADHDEHDDHHGRDGGGHAEVSQTPAARLATICLLPERFAVASGLALVRLLTAHGAPSLDRRSAPQSGVRTGPRVGRRSDHNALRVWLCAGT
jgi:hypothetical protein